MSLTGETARPSEDHGADGPSGLDAVPADRVPRTGSTASSTAPVAASSGAQVAPPVRADSRSLATAWPGQHDVPMRGRVAAAAIAALARWTPYVESEILGLGQLVQPGAVCIDIGAAAGLYTMALSRLAGPTGQVHSVEPLPFANLYVARLLKAGRAANVYQHAVALGAEPGIDIMSVPVGRFGLVTGRSFLDRRAGGPDPNMEFTGQVAVTVSVDTLDSLCARQGIDRLDFIKIDVEGAELQVLEGGKQAIDHARPAILVEIEARHTARYRRTTDEVLAWMFDREYTMHTWRGGWCPARAIDPRTRNYLFQPPSMGRRGLRESQPTPLAG